MERQRLFVQDLVHEPFEVFVVEWWRQRSHVVHHNSKTENVRPMIVRLLLNDLGAEIQGCANLLRLKISLFIDKCTLTKVAELELLVFCD